MELHLEVVSSSSIKRKKPWPRFCWLGKERESVFLLDDKRISEINMVSGRTKKKIPKIHPFLNHVVTMASSHNGLWLCGLLVSGELFLWNRDKDLLKTATAVPEMLHLMAAVQENATRLSLQVSGDGLRVLVVAITGQVFLWECMSVKDLTMIRDGAVKGRWSHICALEDSILPSAQDKEASQHTIFVKTKDMGDACLSAFVFTAGMKLIITCLKIDWEEAPVRVGSEGYNIEWVTKTYSMSCLTPPCKPVRSRGALVPAFSPDGRLFAVALNQRQPKATQVLFVSMQNFVSVSSGLGGCGSKKLEIPSKYIRSYWVGSVCWSPDSLFLACVLKRGSLLMVSRLTGLLTLSSSGCSVDFGPAQFLPLHPLVTYRPHLLPGKGEASLSSSSRSVRDVFRQRYSVTWHPRLLYLIVSDGYMATVIRVLGKPSAALLLKDLIKNTTEDLEKASGLLEKSQGGVRAWLDSVSCLSFGRSLEEFKPKTTDSVISTTTEGSNLPLFLQDQGTLNAPKELLEKVQTFFEDDSDVDGPPAGSHLEDGGRLEFASMFDTVHALDTQTDAAFFASQDFEKECISTERKTPGLHRKLGKIQSKLLAAWAFAMSLGNTVENRTLLLKHNLCCMLRFAALLQLIPSSVVHAGKKKISVRVCILRLLRALLAFLPWDGIHSGGPHCLGLVVSFSQQLIRLLLTPTPLSQQAGQCPPSSCSLSTVLLILKQVSEALDDAYSLQKRIVWVSAGKDPQPHPCPSDMHHVPQLQDVKDEKSSFTHQTQPLPQRPSSRLLGVWQWVYRITQEYMEELKNLKDCDGWEEEQHQVTVIMSQIQVAIQATGAKLEEGPVLLSYPGEHLYLFGSYLKSDKVWRSQICKENLKCCDRRVFKETQLCLALLYSLLSQYRLREAQEFGDHMARLILHRAGHQKSLPTSDSFPCPWVPVDLHSDAACSVVQNLGRFMASYFTNQPLYIHPPHHVGLLPPLHLPHAPSVGRLLPLSQEEVSRAVRQQQLSEVWTVDYAQDLLLLGGLLPESVWLAYHLGDWKTAVSLSLAYTNCCSDKPDFTLLKRRELHLPVDLEAKTIFQVELERLLSSRSDSQGCKDDLSLTEPLEGQNWDMLQVSIQEILKASVMAGVDVISSPLTSLLDTAKALCVSLPLLVPNGLYLPSPPLYCPQPSPNTQDHVGQFAEVLFRHKVSGVIQRLLLLLRSAQCCHPAAQWYISHLWHSRRILHKMKKKYAYPSVDEEYVFPEGLKKVATHSGIFGQRPDKNHHLDSDTLQIITCFRELCALCWMLHVRDQLSVSCRKYQAVRQHDGNDEIPAGPEMTSACVDALSWACRFLPFSCFLNVEEMLQDLLLSLLSELPSLSQVADTLVRAFPEEEESVRVPLREKYKSLLQRVKQCNVLETFVFSIEDDDEGALLMTVIQDKHRLRGKYLRHLQRHLAPPELRLWEEEEEEDKESKQGMAMLRQLSLGTSLSSCNLTDRGSPQMCSEEDTEENTSEAVSPGTHSRATARGKKTKRAREDVEQVKDKSKSVLQGECHTGDTSEDEQPSPPVIGIWEFELEDEEYLNFLELFFSYVLEKGSADEGELPLLKSFSSKLKERELHSLTFDVLTTVHRRQRDPHLLVRNHPGSTPPVFRAGCCYKPVKQEVTSELQTSSEWTEEPISRAAFSASSFPRQRAVGPKGLFGQRQQSSLSLGQTMKRGNVGPETNSIRGAFPTGHQIERGLFGSSTSMEAAVELQQNLDPQLEAQFPKLGRLLVWMVRWADRRVLVPPNSQGKKEESGGTVKEGVMIRVKASAPAILTSLSLLWRRHAALLGADHCSAYDRVPQTQWTVTPVLQPDGDRRLERESSVDTGYPGSANTPITGFDDNAQQAEPFIGSPPHEAEEPASVTTPLFNEPHQVTSDGQQRPGGSQLCLRDLCVTPDGADEYSASEDLETPSSTSSGNTFGIQDTSLKVEDLDFSKNAEDQSSTSSLSNQSGNRQNCLTAEPQDLPAVSSEAELSGSAQMPLSNTPADPPRIQSIPNTPVDPPRDQSIPNTPVDPPRDQSIPNTSVDPARDQFIPNTSVDPARDQSIPNTPVDPLNVQPPIRQSLGEDLFRLVQNINYMSLMEVLGESFSNLQLAQQSYSLVQSNGNFSQPNVPASRSANVFPQPSTLPVQTDMRTAPQSQACVPQSGVSPNTNMPADQTARHSAENYSSAGCHHHDHTIINPPSTANDTSVGLQEMQPLSVQAAEMIFKDSRSLIPPSQGLLATTDNSPKTSALLPANDHPQSDPAAQVWGMKFLNLRPSPTSYPASNYPPTQIVTATKTETHFGLKWTEDKKPRYSIPKRPLSLISLPRATQPRTEKSERTRVQEFPLLPSVTTAHTPVPVQGLRLLRCTAGPQGNITFPKIAPAPSCRPCAVIAAPIREVPMLKLLHIESGAQMMPPMVPPSASVSQLISMKEELKASVGRKQNAKAAQEQLHTLHNATAARVPSCISSKRQKRREEKEGRSKTEVTFRPNESIIPAQDLVNEEPAAKQAVNCGDNASIPCGSSESLLTGQMLLDKAMATSAELHAFASTCKNPPECHDAFTNTEPACSPLLVDKAVSASSPTAQSSGDLQVCTEREKVPQRPEKDLEINGRQFLSVVDLEDKTLHQDLPRHFSPGATEFTSIYTSSPTSAQLHLLATSVIQSTAATSEPQHSFPVPADLQQPTSHIGVANESPSLSHTEPNRDSERVTTEEAKSELCRAVRNQMVAPPRTSSQPSTAWFSSHLTEMDAQLAAVQKIADSLEKDFSNTKMLVKSTQKSPVSPLNVKSTGAVKKTVRLALPREAWTPRRDISSHASVFKEDEKNMAKESVDPKKSWSPYPMTLNCSSNLDNSQVTRIEPDTSGISSLMEESENLGQSGLSDTIEILDELVREGYLSLTDMDWTNSQAEHHSRLDQQQNGWMLQKHIHQDDEREELRTWMRRKQRERLAVYQKHRESLREKEHKPFSSTVTVKPKSKNPAAIQKTRVEKQKNMLLEQYSQRTREAWSLVSSITSNSAALFNSSMTEGPPLSKTTRSSSAPPPDDRQRDYSQSTSAERNLDSGQDRSQSALWSAVKVSDYRRRLGLHRPVTSLPKDRMSQLTRRGMLRDSRSQTKLHSANQSEERHVEHQRKMILSKSPTRRTPVVRRIREEQKRMEKDEKVNVLESTSEGRNLLGPNYHLLDEDTGTRAIDSDMDWLDNLSETSSCLSKIDWAAIDRMTAEF